MPAGLVAALNGGTTQRIRADEKDQGTGSGFGSARRIIETLRGSLKIVASSAAVTEIRVVLPAAFASVTPVRSEEHTSELQSLMRISFAVFCLNKKTM